MKIPNIHDKQTHFHEQQHCRYVKALGTVGIEKAKKNPNQIHTGCAFLMQRENYSINTLDYIAS